MTEVHHREAMRGEPQGTLARLRFPVLGAVVFTLAAVHAARGHWIGDFWEHSAVVRELATHPLHPRHPLLALDAPHALANPYALLVALFCRLTGVTAVTGLAAASIGNLVMLLVALRLFVQRFAAAQASAVAFYLLLFMLLLWGSEPWDYSGFFHIRNIVHTLPYPSAFAFWVSLLLLTLNEKRIAEGASRLLLLIAPLSAMVLVTHPPTFLFLAAGMLAMAVDARRLIVEALVATGALAAATLIALAWPYFSLWTLMTAASEPHARNAAMYSRPLLHTFPALLGLPALLMNQRRTGRRSIVVWVAILLVIYVDGYLTGNYVYGRAVFFVVFLLQLELARYIARCESSTDASGARASALRWTFAAVALCVLLSERSLISTARDLRGGRTYADYTFLRQAVGQYDVMMADGPSTLIAPSYGGKLVAVMNPLPFVPEREQQARRADMRAFFSSATTPSDRENIIRKYGASFVLMSRSARTDSSQVSESTLRALGRVAHVDDRFMLIRVDPSLRQ